MTEQQLLKTLLPKFIKDLEKKKRSPSTILAYRADLEQLINFVEEKKLPFANEVTQESIEAFRDSLLSQKYTAKTVSRKLNAVKTFFRFLVDQNTIQKDPSENVTHPAIKISTPKFLSSLEYSALRDIVREDIRIAAIIELILQTGMRISEVANLKIENIKDKKVIIKAYATQPERDVPLNSRAKEAVNLYLKKRNKTDSPYFFVSKNGKPLAVRNIRAAIDR